MARVARLNVRREDWPLAKPFSISRGSRTVAEVVLAEIRAGEHRGRGESVPYARYGETVEGVLRSVEAMTDAVAGGIGREGLLDAMPAGAARNVLDCALWDLEAKQSASSIWEIAGIAAPRPVVTAYTISLDTAERMGADAAANSERPLLKVKLTGDGDLDRVRAVRAGAPSARLIVDANEGWTLGHLATYGAALAALGVALIEQPLPAGQDDALAALAHPIPICADESCHTSQDLDRLIGLYDCVNIKLDKAGGLTEALRLKAAARERGFMVMVGCMVGTSLAMAPAHLLAQDVAFVDLDAPLLLARDRQPGLRYEGSIAYPPKPNLWG
ncbi:MAG: dipeptide epimerase [Alphaproteobacteria bacterium]|nr:dipeptide epimerase [Alphaproteobacteria bacterium]